jgi:hypothetical protein
MWPRLKNILLRRFRLKESWIFFFILGFIMINFPFIDIFNKPCEVIDMPLLFLYLYCEWAISILVIYLFASTLNLPDDSNNNGARH